MKILIASDIHGSEYYCKALLERYAEEEFDSIVLLGDILYHGPRNDLPKDYCPKSVISMLNPLSDKILCVKGNCESDVDGMVLDFPVDTEFAMLYFENARIYLTHGHKIRNDIGKINCILLNGHTHIPLCDSSEGYLHLNPGSVSIPKENSHHSYMTFDGKTFCWKDVLSGETYKEYSL
ncbi:MAG: phosphodiesterase [Clostridia bacterium]|nr:phosphodiesterase [Clostridia bacterium]